MPQLTNDQLEQIGQLLLAPKKGLSLGPFFVALILDTFFLGILVVQAVKYITTFRRDRLYIMLLVAAVSALAVASTLLCLVWMYEIFVLNFGLWHTLFSVKYLSWFYVLDCVVMIGVQAFFAARAFELVNRNYIVLAEIVIFMAAAFISGILVKVRGNQLGSSADPDDKTLKIYVYIWLGATVAADMSITVVILTMLIKRRTGWKVTDRLITKLLKLTFGISIFSWLLPSVALMQSVMGRVESQLPPTMVATGLMIEYAVLVNTAPYISIPFILLQQKIYAFALFHTLNSRDSLAGGGSSGAMYTFSGYASGSGSTLKYKVNSREENMRPSHTTTLANGNASTNGLKSIQITTETDVHIDSPDAYQLEQMSAKGHKFSNRSQDRGMVVDLEAGGSETDGDVEGWDREEKEGGSEMGSKVSILGERKGSTGRHPFSNM